MLYLVSVIIPTYGRPSNLRRAIVSVLAQSYNNVEIIVVDDNGIGTDFGVLTEVVLSEFSEIRSLRYFQHERNLNGSAARNTGIKHARGELVAFLDDDDEFFPAKLAKQVAYLKRENKFEAVYCKANYVKNARRFYTSRYNKTGDLTMDLFCSLVELNTSGLMFRKASLDAIDNFDESFFRNQDYEIMVRFCSNFKVGFIDEVLLKINVDSRINEPSVLEYINIRHKFLEDMNAYLENLSCSEISYVYDFFNFDICVYALRRRELNLAFFYFRRINTKKNVLIKSRYKFLKVFLGAIHD
jgi:glycosyltransferase involved in cell wall biosynthesis